MFFSGIHKESWDMCDIAYVIKDHLPAIFQLMNVEVPSYNIQLQTTKCLNTAVIMLYLFAGEGALEATSFCDVPNVRERAKTSDFSLHVWTALRQELLQAPTPDLPRTLFYVMLTNGHLQLKTDRHSTKMFPGHVFVLERLHGGLRFNMYQSYIGHYDMSKQIDMVKSLSMSRVRMTGVIDCLGRVVNKDVWDEGSTKDWKLVSLVDESRFMGHMVRGNICLCFRTVTTTACVEHLRVLIDNALPKIRAVIDISDRHGAQVYTGPSPITLTEPTLNPLTYKEMESELMTIRDKL